jgi:hypothetical protein
MTKIHFKLEEVWYTRIRDSYFRSYTLCLAGGMKFFYRSKSALKQKGKLSRYTPWRRLGREEEILDLGTRWG